MAEEAQEPKEGFEIELPEEIYTPAGLNIQKVETPEGQRITLLRFFIGFPVGPGTVAPFKVITVKIFGDDVPRQIVSGLTGGVHIARPDEVPK